MWRSIKCNKSAKTTLKTKCSQSKKNLIDTLKAMIKTHVEDLEQYLVKEALTQPHRTHISPTEREEDHVKILSQPPQRDDEKGASQ